MNGPGVVRMVAGREIRQRARTRAFRISTAVLFVAALAGVGVPHLIGHSTTTYRIGLAGAVPSGTISFLDGAARAMGARVHTTNLASASQASSQVSAGHLDAALVDGSQLITQKDSSSSATQLVDRAVASARLAGRLTAAGAPPPEVASLIRPAPLPVRVLKPPSPSTNANRSLALAGGILLYLMLLSYGMATSYGVLEEKTNRLADVLLSMVRPAQLLAGKIVGIGVIGVMQVLILAVPAGALALALGSLHVPAGTPLTFLAVLAWFLLGYGLYSCAFAALASVVGRQEDLASALTPLSFLLLGGYGLAFNAALGNADGTLATVTSFIPPFAPMVMVVRAAVGHLAPWEVPLSMALVVLTTAGLVVAGGRIYSDAILRTGAKVKLRDAYRSGTTESRPLSQDEPIPA